jgi:phage FluMu protein Com
MIQPDYKNPSALQILRGAPNACWRKCQDCSGVSLHMDVVMPWVQCPHCKSQNTKVMHRATGILRRHLYGNKKGIEMSKPTKKAKPVKLIVHESVVTYLSYKCPCCKVEYVGTIKENTLQFKCDCGQVLKC